MASVEIKVIGKSILAGILIAVGTFSAVVLLGNSWIKFLVIGLLIASGLIWLLSRGVLRRVIKYTILAVMIFSISFAAFQDYSLWNAGPPPIFIPSKSGVTVSYSNILNVSLTEILQSVKNTTAFNLLKLENPGDISLEFIKIDTTFKGGSIEVMLIQKSSNLGFKFACNGGQSYRASLLPLEGSYSQMFPNAQPPEETLKQLDGLGLHWFFDRAIEGYVNKTGSIPEINALQISLQWDNYGTYRGMTLLMSGFIEENFTGHSVFFADFQPNGTLLYLNTNK